MKTIKIKFVGFWKNINPETLLCVRLLREKYDVVVCDDADYVFCGCFPPYFEYCKYPQVRIMICGENYIPDFNLVDYGICPYPIDFLDRCLYIPQCMSVAGSVFELEKGTRSFDEDFVKGKEYFANFIASHESEYGIRGNFFKALSKYKRVESPGSYLNNMTDGFSVNRKNGSKADFQRKCKFTLCFESTKHEGFVTEKITEAFLADTIPIYYGSDIAKTIFNPKAFINVSDFDSFDKAIEYIIKIDNDDELYLEMMNQPVLNNPNYFSEKIKEYKAFLDSIFEQPLEKAYRRSRVYSPKSHEEFLVSKISKRSLFKPENLIRFFKKK